MDKLNRERREMVYVLSIYHYLWHPHFFSIKKKKNIISKRRILG